MNEHYDPIKCYCCGTRYSAIDIDAMDDMGLRYLYKGDGTFYCPRCWDRYKQRLKEAIEHG